MQEAMVNLATSTAADREEVDMLTATINTLAMEHATITAQLVTTLAANTIINATIVLLR